MVVFRRRQEIGPLTAAEHLHLAGDDLGGEVGLAVVVLPPLGGLHPEKVAIATWVLVYRVSTSASTLPINRVLFNMMRLLYADERHPLEFMGAKRHGSASTGLARPGTADW